MAGSIRTEPVTREYEDGWERTFGLDAQARELRDSLLREKKWAEENGLNTFNDVMRGAFHHEDSEDIEDAVRGDVDVEVEVSRTNPRIPADAASLLVNDDDAVIGWSPSVRERESSGVASHYDCPRCGWHLAYSSDRCGNSTCPSRRR